MHHRDSYDIGDGVGSIVALLLVIALISAFAFVKATSLIIHTFVKYPRKKVLWAFLAGFVVATGVGGLLAYLFQNPAWLDVGLVGFLALTLACYIVELRNSHMLLKQPDPIVQQVLHTNWFGETHDAQAA